MGHRVEIKTADGWVLLPNANVTLELDTDEPEDFDSPYAFKATTSTYTFSAAPVSPEAFALLTGATVPSDTPIYNGLVEERIKYWEGLK